MKYSQMISGFFISQSLICDKEPPYPARCRKLTSKLCSLLLHIMRIAFK